MGLAFGATLAASLEEHPPKAALAAAKVMQEPERLISFLENRFQGCKDLLARLRGAGENLSSVTNWGSPVLLT